MPSTTVTDLRHSTPSGASLATALQSPPESEGPSGAGLVPSAALVLSASRCRRPSASARARPAHGRRGRPGSSAQFPPVSQSLGMPTDQERAAAHLGVPAAGQRPRHRMAPGTPGTRTLTSSHFRGTHRPQTEGKRPPDEGVCPHSPQDVAGRACSARLRARGALSPVAAAFRSSPRGRRRRRIAAARTSPQRRRDCPR